MTPKPSRVFWFAVAALAAAAFSAAPSGARRDAVVKVVERVSPGVVNISAEQTVRQRPDLFDLFFGGVDAPARRYRTRSLGSGVVIDAQGVILTNDHVISGASKIVATTKSGREFLCRVAGSDSDNDLAVLRIEGAQAALPTIAMGTSSDLMIGERVIAIGNPFGLSNTVTVGVVSAVGRTVSSENNSHVYTDFIQTDASINPGNSGGPLVNIDGAMIGINTAIIGGAQGIGFAIPIDRARRIVGDLLNYGEVKPAWIGVRGRTNVSRWEGLETPRGFRLQSVFPDSPAARAGLQKGDVIIEVDGRQADSRDAFDTILSSISPGRQITVTFRRGSEERRVSLRAATPPADLGEHILHRQVGIDVASGRGKVRITRVAPGSPADRAGIQSGDAIVGINGLDARSVEDIDRALSKQFNRTTLLLVVERGGWQYTLTFPLD
jgi:S1-C subfamily serine protease